MNNVDLFGHVVDRIADSYDRLGHKLGWRFLYTPKLTLAPLVSLMFVGYNPGGDVYQGSQASVETGNAYRVERWRRNTLQKRVRSLLSEIGTVVAPASSADEFIDATLTSNICPFRSPRAAKLHRKEDSLEFSRLLWATIFEAVEPRIILANGKETSKLFQGSLVTSGYQITGRQNFRTGWGDTTYDATTLRDGPLTTLVIGLPHLSIFDILDPEARFALTTRIADAIG